MIFFYFFYLLFSENDLDDIERMKDMVSVLFYFQKLVPQDVCFDFFYLYDINQEEVTRIG